jgi:protein-S-isoprenylcysteine O-methyltransferase Ste14
MSKRTILIYTLLLLALIIVFPKPDSVFLGIILTLFGFVLLNVYGYSFILPFPEVIKLFIFAGAVSSIGYGWGIMIYCSDGSDSSIFGFIGFLLLAIAVIGWILTIQDWFKHIPSVGLLAESLYTEGIYSLVRHPQVLFSIMLLLGFDFYYWLPSLILTTPIWIIGFIGYAVLEEKIELIPRFGEQYLNYSDITPGILPTKESIKKFLALYR